MSARSRMALGGAGFSIVENPDEDAAILAIRAALDSGITQFDSSRAYATVDDPFHNETLFRHALEGRALDGSDTLVATKGGHFRIDGTTWGADGSRDALRRDCEGSLRALGLNALPLYYLHKVDPQTPLEESIGALAELRDEGKIIEIGVCNVTAEQLARAVSVAPIEAVQNRFSPFQSHDRSVLAAAENAGIPFYAYSPLGGSKDRARLVEQLPNTVRLAAELEISFQRLILEWLLSLSPAITVISGARRPLTVEDSAAAMTDPLSPDVAARIAAEVSTL